LFKQNDVFKFGEYFQTKQMQNQFNLFDVLSEQQKEISHTTVLKFLLEEDDSFYHSFFKTSKPQQIEFTKLNFKLNDTLRCHLFIEAEDKIIVVQNGYTILPHKNIFHNYDIELLRLKKRKPIEKYLLYFDQSDKFNIPPDWKQVTFFELAQSVTAYEKVVANPNKKLFLNHYILSLTKDTETYRAIKNGKDLTCIIDGEFENYKFWFTIIVSEIASMLAKKYDREVKAFMGGKMAPYLLIHFPEWSSNNDSTTKYEIQYNWRKLRYVGNNYQSKQFIKEEINRLKTVGFNLPDYGKYRDSVPGNPSEGIIYEEDIIEKIHAHEEIVTFNSIVWAIDRLIAQIAGTK
jgi:hypothetical protein